MRTRENAVLVRLSDAERGMLRDVAALAGLSQSAWLRQAIRAAAAAAAVMGRPITLPIVGACPTKIDGASKNR